MRRSACFLTVLGVLLAVAAPGYTQGGTTSTITGLVVDSSGAVVPGADVTATHVATNTISQTVSNAEGLFSLPGLQIGIYTVTVTLQGFKTVAQPTSCSRRAPAPTSARRWKSAA